MSKRTLACRLFAPFLLVLPATAQGANLCADALNLPISGPGPFNFDTTAATTDGPPDPACDKFGTSQIESDVWFAWTPDAYCDYTIETCGMTTGDTKIALYDTAFCSQLGTSMIDCNDDTCGTQSSVTGSQLEAGKTYLIRVGAFPGAAGTQGSFTITPSNCTADLFLLIAGRDAIGGRVLVYDNTGSLDDPDFILLPHPPGPGGDRFPVEPGMSDPPFPGPGGFADSEEIWTSDKTFDTIYRHPNEGGTGTCSLGEFEGQGLDDPRGYAFADGKLYVAGLSGGQGVLQIYVPGVLTPTTVNLGFEPWDVIEYQDRLLVSNISGGTIEEVSFAGVVEPVPFSQVPPGFTPIQNPRQLTVTPEGLIMAAGQGIFFYNPDGTQIGTFQTPFFDVLSTVMGGTSCTELNGVYKFPNFLFFWTCNEGVFIFTNGISIPAPGSPMFEAQFIRFFARPSIPTLGVSYCLEVINSTGCAALMSALGSASVSANDLVLRAETLPVNQFGVFFYGPDQAQVPFGNGIRCIAPGATGIGRLDVVSSGPHGLLEFAVDNTDPPFPAVQITAGSTWNFQAWYRDPQGGGAFFNLSDGIEILFSP